MEIPKDEVIGWLRDRKFRYSNQNDSGSHDIWRATTGRTVSVRRRKLLSPEHVKDVLTKSGATTAERDAFIEKMKSKYGDKK